MSDESDVFRVTKELGLRLRSLRGRFWPTQSKLARKFAALRSRGEPSVPAQLALDGLDRQLRRKWRCFGLQQQNRRLGGRRCSDLTAYLLDNRAGEGNIRRWPGGQPVVGPQGSRWHRPSRCVYLS